MSYKQGGLSVSKSGNQILTNSENGTQSDKTDQQ